MRLAKFVPVPLRQRINDLRHGVARLRRSVDNSRKAFVPTDYGYRLMIMSVGGREIAYREGTADESVIADSFDHDEFFRAVPEYRPSPDGVIVDIGAHIGTFALLAASSVPRGRVIAIEASEETFNLLRINVSLNGATNVVPLHCAIHDRRGTTTLHHDIGNWGNTIMKRMTSRGETVETRTLADVFSEQQIERCELVKFNCEGAEFPILMSTPLEVLRRIDRMIVLYHCDIARDYSLDALCERLAESGMSVERKHETLSRGWLIARR